MMKFVISFILNGFAHYNFKNRIEYLKLLFRVSKPKKYCISIENQLQVNRVVVVSIINNHKRRTFMINQLQAQKINYWFFNAIEGKQRINRDIISERSRRYLTNGSVGCWVSHFKIWEAFRFESENCVIVLEDDVKLFENFIFKVNEVIKFTPSDADIIFISTGNNYSRNRRSIINNFLFVPYQVRNGAYAYVITRQGAYNLTRLVKFVKVTRGGIDSAIGSLIRDKKINAYHLLDSLCEVDFSLGSNTKN